MVFPIPSLAWAQFDKADSPIYSYTNREGTEVFTNDPEQIPAEYRSSSKKITLPSTMLIPPPSPLNKEASAFQRAGNWFKGLSPLNRVMVVGILPLAVLSGWAFMFFRKHTDSPSMKLFFKLGMVVLVMSTLYLFYFLYMKNQAEKLFGPVPAGTDIKAIPRMMIEPIQKKEEDRFRKIEEIANER